MTACVMPLPTRPLVSTAADGPGDNPRDGDRREQLIDVLAPYPHAANCPACRSYAVEGLAEFTPATVLSATLAHHESAHRCDPLSAASEFFGLDTSP